MGQRVIQLTREGVAAGIVSKPREDLIEFAKSANGDESGVLSALMEIADENEDNIEQIALMERIIALDPSNTRTRFSLAFKHSEIGNDGLSLFHYLKIPAAARDPVTWNNLGVALDKFELKCRSVDAYRKSESAGETLAISNLALKFLSAGFRSEALNLCEEVVGKPEVHKNVLLTLAQIRGIDDEEGKALQKHLDKIKHVNEFYVMYGRGLTFATPAVTAKKWNVSECDLDVTMEQLSFTAKGTFQKSNRPSMGLGSMFYQEQPPEAWKIEYSGQLHGRVVDARVLRERIDPRAPPTLLGSFLDSERTLLILSDDGSEFAVMENVRGQDPKFYKIKSVQSQ